MLDGENAQEDCEDIHFETQHMDGSRKLENDNWAGTQSLKRTRSIDEDRTNCQSGRWMRNMLHVAVAHLNSSQRRPPVTNVLCKQTNIIFCQY